MLLSTKDCSTKSNQRSNNEGQGNNGSVGKSAYHASLRMWVQPPRTNIKARYTAQGYHSHAPMEHGGWDRRFSEGSRASEPVVLTWKKTRILSQIRKKSGIDKLCLSSNVHTHTHICLRERKERERGERDIERREREERDRERRDSEEREREREIMSNILDVIVPGKQTLHLSLSF